MMFYSMLYGKFSQYQIFFFFSSIFMLKHISILRVNLFSIDMALYEDVDAKISWKKFVFTKCVKTVSLFRKHFIRSVTLYVWYYTTRYISVERRVIYVMYGIIITKFKIIIYPNCRFSSNNNTDAALLHGLTLPYGNWTLWKL